jgi:hypothetical protein
MLSTPVEELEFMQSLPKLNTKLQGKRDYGERVEKIIYARQGFLAYVPLIGVVFFLLVAAVVESFVPSTDMARYECYATAFWRGNQTLSLLPAGQCQFMFQFNQFHTFPYEYPPFSLLIFSIPLPLPILSYPIKFALTMAGVAALIFWLLLKYGPRGSAATFAGYLLIGAVGTAFARFDLIPAALTLLCLVLAERKRWTLAYIALALGVLVKIYPVILLPFLFMAEQRDSQSFYFSQAPLTIRTISHELWRVLRSLPRWRVKNLLVAVGIMTVTMVFFGELNFRGAVLSSPAYIFLRPFQTESVGAVILWLVSMAGVPIVWQVSSNSVNILSPISDVIGQGSVILLFLGYIFILIMSWQGKMDLVQASIAALMVVIVTGKVFSPQYLIWLIPLLAYSGASSRMWWLIWGATSLLTIAIYPGYYSLTTHMAELPTLTGFMQVISSRNELFILLTVAYLLNMFNLRQREPLPDAREGIMG